MVVDSSELVDASTAFSSSVWARLSSASLAVCVASAAAILASTMRCAAVQMAGDEAPRKTAQPKVAGSDARASNSAAVFASPTRA